MSNLIPTPRTDKNGVTTIRHMKPESTGSRSPRPFPRVAAAAPAPEKPLTTEETLELVFPNGYPDPYRGDTTAMTRSIEFLKQHSPETLPAVVTMLNSGAESAQADVRRRFQIIVASLAQAMHSRLPGEGDTQFNRSVSSYLHKAKPNQLREYWNCLNVMEESGITDDTIPGRLDNVIRQEFKRELPKLDTDNQNDTFWRGATAYTIIDLFPHTTDDMTPRERYSVVREFYRNSKKFIDYAGKHKDISLVISIARELKTIVVSDIKNIIAQGKATPVLGDGAL